GGWGSLRWTPTPALPSRGRGRRSSGYASIAIGIVAHQNLALAGVVGGGDDAFALHALDQGGGLVVADAEAPLDIGGGGLLVGEHDMDGLVVKLVAGAGIGIPAAIGAKFAALLVILDDRIEIIGRTLALEMSDHGLDLGVGDEGAVQALGAAARGHVEHVAIAQELLGPLLAQNGAAVDLTGHHEGDAGWEIGLDGAGDDVHRRPLGGGDDVDAGGAGHLGE